MILTIAVEPDIKLVERLTFIQEDLGKIITQRGADSRWIRPEFLQVPVLCLGRHDDGAIPECNEILRACARQTAPFFMTTAEITAYPSPECPRLIQIAAIAQDHLTALRERLMDAFRAANIRFDGRPYQATMLLGRVATKNGRVDISDAMNAIHDLNFGQSEVFEMALCSSELSGSGPVHNIVSRFPFEGQ